jgi:hypothetical protein
MRRSARATSIALISEDVSQKAWIVMCGIRSVSTLLLAGTAAAGVAAGSGVRPAATAGANTEVISDLAPSIWAMVLR